MLLPKILGQKREVGNNAAERVAAFGNADYLPVSRIVNVGEMAGKRGGQSKADAFSA